MYTWYITVTDGTVWFDYDYRWMCVYNVKKNYCMFDCCFIRPAFTHVISAILSLLSRTQHEASIAVIFSEIKKNLSALALSFYWVWKRGWLTYQTHTQYKYTLTLVRASTTYTIHRILKITLFVFVEHTYTPAHRTRVYNTQTHSW